jgi:hypothetical protein
MKTAIHLILVSIFLIAAGPVYSGSIVQIFHCEQDADATEEQLEAVASEWLKAARGMKGGEQLQLYLRYPVVADMGEYDFAFVIQAPSLEVWGKFHDSYPGSEASKVDDKFHELADCPDSALWEGIKVE